jgi:hypothetical protein
MKIVCNIPELDNVVTVGQSKYHFRRGPGGKLVCNVEDEETVAAILSRGPEFELAAPETELAEDKLSDEDEEELEAAALARATLESKTLEELQALYAEKFGRASHPASKHETLVEKLLA